MKILGFIFSIFLLAIIVLFFYTWYRLHAKLALHAREDDVQTESSRGAVTAYVTTRDGFKIAYQYFPVPDPKAVVILVHGYSDPGGKSQMLWHVEYLKAAGYSTAILDLRSFGESDGNHIGLGTKEWQDVEAVYEQMKSLPENAGKKIGYLGISMGAATSIVTAGKTGTGDFVIASVPYADLDSLYHFQIQAAGFPVAIIHPMMKLAGYLELGSAYREAIPSAVIGKMHVPILLISATQDAEVHRKDAKLLYEKANEPKELWVVDSPHDVYSAHKKEFEEKVLGFLSTSLNVSN